MRGAEPFQILGQTLHPPLLSLRSRNIWSGAGDQSSERVVVISVLWAGPYRNSNRPERFLSTSNGISRAFDNGC